MRLTIVQIVLDGMPFIPIQVAEFEKLNINWHLYLVHGAAANTNSTRWCKPQMPRLSRDGTNEFINSLLKHPRITVIQRQWWAGGKDQMVQAAISKITDPCTLFLPDVDEMFSANQIEKIVKMFDERPEAMRAYFYCHYFLGRNIVSTSTNAYGNRLGEFLRAFRFMPNMSMSQHEPPVLSGNRGLAISREETRDIGLVFNHFAWLLSSQVRYKEKFYGYDKAFEHWQRLQENKIWPVKNLRDFLPWVGDGASADLFENVFQREENPALKFIH